MKTVMLLRLVSMGVLAIGSNSGDLIVKQVVWVRTQPNTW